MRPSPRDLSVVGAKEDRCHAGRVQVMVEHAVHRGTPVGFILAGHGFFHGVGAQQIVTGVATGNVLGEQMLVAQFSQR